MKYRPVLLIVVLILLAGFTNRRMRAPKPAHWPKEGAELAVYATEIPLYPGAKLESAMGSDTYGDEPDSHMEGMAWWFTVDAGYDDVVAWYDREFPDAKREVTDESWVVYTLVPEDAEEGEDMGIIIEPEGKIRPFEHTKAGKHD